MPNTTVRAAGEAMPAAIMNRRWLLRGIPAVGAAVLAASLPDVANASIHSMEAELIAIFRDLSVEGKIAVIERMRSLRAAEEGGASSVTPHEQVKRDAEALAASMAVLHGGTWGILINHNGCMAAVSRSFRDTPSAPGENLRIDHYRIISADGAKTDLEVSS